MVMHSNFTDFLVFLYVHMAMADGLLHPDEEKVILEKMKKLYPGKVNLKEKFDDAHREYRTTDPSSIMQIVKDSFKQFSQVKSNQMYHIYMDLYDVVNADGKIEESERVALEALKSIIDTHSEAIKK